MSSLNLIDAVKTTSNAKFAFALVMSVLLTACGSGAGGEDAVENVSIVESQTPIEEVQEPAPIEVAAVQITTQPQGVTVVSGGNASFSISASGGGTLSFQWRKGGQNIEGATSNSLALNNVTLSDAALYDVVVSNSVGSQSSLSALLTVNTPVVIVEPVEPVIEPVEPVIEPVEPVIEPVEPVIEPVEPIVNPVVIVSQPEALTVEENSAASFSVQVTGDGDITYQWLKDGDIIDGATSSSYSLENTVLTDAATYSVIVRNSEGPVFSDAAALSVTAIELPSSIELTWDIPQEREDGSELALYEINGYVIVYGTDQENLSGQLTVDGATSTNAIFADLTTGTYYFAIATVDSDGVQGAYSGVIQQSI